MRHFDFESVGRLALPIMALGALVVSLLDFFGLLGQLEWLSLRIPAITLLLISASVLYWLQEQKHQHEKVERISTLISTGFGAEDWSTTEEAMRYLTQRFGEPLSTVDQAGMAPSLFPPEEYSKYDQALTRMLKKGVLYRHAVMLDATRWQRVKSLLKVPDARRYFVRYYDQTESALPNLSFVVLDQREVVMRYPYGPDQSEAWVSIKHVPTVRLFARYFDSLYDHGRSLTKEDQNAIEELDRRYGGPKGP